MYTHFRNALRQELHRRNLNFSQITVTDNKAAFSNLDAGKYGDAFSQSTMYILICNILHSRSNRNECIG